jgi:F0F1-type ATP synthase alpha subunit
MRVDLLRPMTKGNLIVLQGHRSTGKTHLATSTIKRFLDESSEHRAIYVGMSTHGREVQKSIASANLLTIGVNEND